jgi:RNA polymerase sigma factor (sigma-70 family)
MATPRWGNVLRGVRSLLDEGVVAAVSDRELLERYATSGGESAERAFATLVDRHGPMVLRVCRSVLGDEHAAQDAFQATFLVLSRKARSLWVRDSIGPWLHGVAYRISSCARNAAARRQFHEHRATEWAVREAGAIEPDELAPILHQEVDRLPDRYRSAVVLCYLEGLTHEQAAERLRCPVGTVRSRLATGRDRLRRRLILRGMATAADALDRTTTREESAGMVPATLAQAAVRNALLYAAKPAAGTVPATAALLAEKGMKIMLIARLKTLTITLLLLGGCSVGLFAYSQQRKDLTGPDEPKAQAAVGDPLPRTMRLILEARVETVREILKQELERLRFNSGATRSDMFDETHVWSRRLMEDRLRLAATAGERLDAVREHRNRMAMLEQVMGRYAAVGQGRSSDGLKGKYYRLEAHQFLAEAGGDPEKEPPVVDLEKDFGPLPPPPPSPAPAAGR